MFPRGLAWLAVFCLAASAWAGGSGLNVVVVVNQNSSNSVQLGNDYCSQRGVPPQNVFRLTGWPGGAISWSRSEFEMNLRNPLLAMLRSAALTNQVRYVLLSMDIPYRVAEGDSYNSTTAALFYGFKTNTAAPPGLPATCSLPDSSSNSYAFSESSIDAASPDTAPTNSLLAMMLTDDSLAKAEAILAIGVAGDSTFPTQAVYLEKTSDSARNVRFFEFDEAIFNSRVRGDASLVRINSDATTFTNTLGLLTGLASFSLPTNAFAPGAAGDSLTSFGGYLLENSGQTSLLAYLNAGAAGSYGTIIEPCNYTEKFPHPMLYFYQNRGFSLAEAYYQSLLNPYQGLLVGEPLSAPFALASSGSWNSLTNDAAVQGQILLTPGFSSLTTDRPLSQVDLFVDGTLFSVMTNLPPATGNQLLVTLDGHNIPYTVSAGETLGTVAAGVAGAINAQTNLTRIMAFPAGDRIELQSLDVSTPGSNSTLSVSAFIGTAAELTAQLTAARASFLDTTAIGYLGVIVQNVPSVGDWLQLDFLKTNGSRVSVSVTNTVPGTSISSLAQSLMNRVNSAAALQLPDGVLAADLYADSSSAQFFLYARTSGWSSAQIQATFTASVNLAVQPTGPNSLEDNLSDLRPRNHLYLQTGLTSLPVRFSFDTTQIPDGFHELSAVAYEGTSVRTQARVTRNVEIRNTTLSATLTPLVSGSNVTLDFPLQFSVTATGGTIEAIELFSTGGSVGTASHQSSAVFSVPSYQLGVGVHPFYALVTDTLGSRYRTRTAWIRLVPSFEVSYSGPPYGISWQTVPGLNYDVLGSSNLLGGFQVLSTLTASNTSTIWPTPDQTRTAYFYRVRFHP